MNDHPDLPPQILQWITGALPEGTSDPCGHYYATQKRNCGNTPTRLYNPGRRCFEHALDQNRSNP